MVPAAAALAFRVLCQRACGAAGTSHHAQRNLSEQVVGTHSHTQPIRMPDEALGIDPVQDRDTVPGLLHDLRPSTPALSYVGATS
jgi:hypothetical protein